MLETGLCMLVKNEAANVLDCLSPIVDLFARVVVIDTGSTDRTRELLREHLGIEAIRAELDPRECHALAVLRNRGFEMLGTPWLMTLDADERIERSELAAVLASDDARMPAGVFCAWNTHYSRDGDDLPVEDYKLCLFRGSHRHRGLVHDTVQPDLRERGATACWSHDFSIRHFPSRDLVPFKESWYAQRLDCARRREPGWLRYDWFIGHAAYRHGHFALARAHLERLHRLRPSLFPVESLNASMVLASIHAQDGDPAAADAVLASALGYHRRMSDDFEVRVNFRLGPWLQQAASLAARGDHGSIVPYAFPY